MKRLIVLVVALMLPVMTASPGLADLISAPDTEDTYVVSNWPDLNYGDNDLMTAGTGASVGIYYRIYLKFDLSGLPAGATVSSVKLSLYCNFRVGTPRLTVYHADSQLSDGTVWTEHNVTWNQQPGTTTDLGFAEGLTAKTWNTWNLLPAGITPADLANKALCLQIRQEGGGANNYGIFATKETANPALIPKLEVTLKPSPPSYLLLLLD